jgi:APA family basic amino acid/polyamine antiporter
MIEYIAHPENIDKSLKRSIGPTGLILLGLGSIIGAGIFIVTGVTAANYSGPALLISFIISAVACTFTALCYAEFASMTHRRQCLYLYLCYTRRDMGMDDWMGPHI